MSIDIPPADGLHTTNGYSHVVTGQGRLVVVAGQLAFDASGNLVGPGDIEAQTRQVFRNLATALAAAGAGFQDVVRLGYFVTDIGALATVRDVRDEFIDTSRPPASSAVQVAALFRPDCLVEVEALALTST